MVALEGGACVVALGGGGMHGCSRGVCVVAPGGHAWLLWGVAWLLLRACVVAPRAGMHGCSGGGAFMVAPGGMCGCSGGVHGCSWGGAWLLGGERACDTTRYGDTITERVVRILLECILVEIVVSVY